MRRKEFEKSRWYRVSKTIIAAWAFIVLAALLWHRYYLGNRNTPLPWAFLPLLILSGISALLHFLRKPYAW